MPDSKEEKFILIKIKHFFEPRKEFIEETRVLFLTKLEILSEKQVVSIKSNAIFIFSPIMKYALVTVFIVIFLSGGLVIYADSNNVSASNPLYGFKKTGEKVRLMMAPKERRPMLDHEIAQRRMEEIHGLKDKNSHVMDNLNNEYNRNINLSLDEMANLDKERLDQIKELCAKMAQTMAQKAEIVNAIDINDHTPDHFKEHCGQFMMLPPIPVNQ